METAGAQCLLLAGFFEDQMRRRHNIHWYAELGAGFFRRAAAAEQSASKAKLLDTIGRHFEPWRRRHARLSHELRDSPYLISWPRPGETDLAFEIFSDFFAPSCNASASEASKDGAPSAPAPDAPAIA
jgi:hypothetical protein